MKRNHIVVFVNRKHEIEVNTRYVLSIFLLGKGRIRVTGHVRQVSITIKRQGGRRKHASNKASHKTAGILSIGKVVNPAFSVTKCIKLRNGCPLDIPMMHFGWGKKKDISGYMSVKSNEDKEKQKSTDLKNIATSIFEKVNPIAYVKLTDAIIDMMDVRPRTAKEYIRYMRGKAIIEQLADQTYQLKIFRAGDVAPAGQVTCAAGPPSFFGQWRWR